MEKLVLTFKEVAAPLNRSHRSLERMVDRKTGVLDLSVGTMKTVKLAGSRVIPRHEFERFLRDAGLVLVEPATPATAPEPTPTPARRGRQRLSAMAGAKGGV